MCEKAPKVGERESNGGDGTILRAHIDPEIVGGIATRMKKLLIHGAPHRILRNPYYMISSGGNISPELC